MSTMIPAFHTHPRGVLYLHHQPYIVMEESFLSLPLLSLPPQTFIHVVDFLTKEPDLLTLTSISYSPLESCARLEVSALPRLPLSLLLPFSPILALFLRLAYCFTQFVFSNWLFHILAFHFSSLPYSQDGNDFLFRYHVSRVISTVF